jgi:hypothetical protein
LFLLFGKTPHFPALGKSIGNEKVSTRLRKNTDIAVIDSLVSAVQVPKENVYRFYVFP